MRDGCHRGISFGIKAVGCAPEDAASPASEMIKAKTRSTAIVTAGWKQKTRQRKTMEYPQSKPTFKSQLYRRTITHKSNVVKNDRCDVDWP